MIYSTRSQPKANESNRLIFHMGEVSELRRKTMLNNSHVFNFTNCSVVFRVITVLVK